ncbi:hypothetical protein BCD48_03810 [Pseudofrankia sp. BMG5.36]|nr:hypothetical protein BCD48_03810 [Pseudofrankia sp. BMG5.36]
MSGPYGNAAAAGDAPASPTAVTPRATAAGRSRQLDPPAHAGRSTARWRARFFRLADEIAFMIGIPSK